MTKKKQTNEENPKNYGSTSKLLTFDAENRIRAEFLESRRGYCWRSRTSARAVKTRRNETKKRKKKERGAGQGAGQEGGGLVLARWSSGSSRCTFACAC